MARLAIIDWGIGGVGLLKLIKAERRGAAVTYFSDTGATPYGKLSRSELVARLEAVLRYLKAEGVTHVAIGCNAASTAIDDIDPQGLEIVGVIKPAIKMTARMKPRRLGLIGGRRTVVSGVYRRGFAKLGIDISQRIAQPLSALIESGDTSSEKLVAEAARILAPIRRSSHILLACTHYPAIAPVIASLVAKDTVLIDPAEEVVRAIRKWPLEAAGKDVYLTTGDVDEMRRAARNAFGFEMPSAKRIAI